MSTLPWQQRFSLKLKKALLLFAWFLFWACKKFLISYSSSFEQKSINFYNCYFFLFLFFDFSSLTRKSSSQKPDTEGFFFLKILGIELKRERKKMSKARVELGIKNAIGEKFGMVEIRSTSFNFNALSQHNLWLFTMVRARFFFLPLMIDFSENLKSVWLKWRLFPRPHQKRLPPVQDFSQYNSTDNDKFICPLLNEVEDESTERKNFLTNSFSLSTVKWLNYLVVLDIHCRF